MKVLILENRYKTHFWDAIAEYLLAKGHEVCWIVQNPSFMPSHGRVNVIRFPRRAELSSAPVGSELDRVKSADRHINYFGGSSSHYSYYKNAIWKVLDSESPELVIGEATLFHELIAVEWCRMKDVRFFHPSMPGYPSGRYSIYLLDTKEALPGAVDVPCDEDCLALAEAIRKRESIPDYMRNAVGRSSSLRYPSHGSISNRLKLILSYLKGERFNTPSPLCKVRLQRIVRRNLKIWSELASAQYELKVQERYVLYPMQMQPESNIDLWGQAYRDQTALIEQIASSLPEGWKLLVKLNPKAKYELTSALLKLVRSNKNITPVPFLTSMATVFDAASLICTVTGTVAVEGVLSRKPIVQFGPGILSGESGYVQLENAADVARIIMRVESGEFPLANDHERIGLVKKLYSLSYPGNISDPATSPSVLEQDNVKRIADNLVKVAKSCRLVK